MMPNGGAFAVEEGEATKARQKSPPIGRRQAYENRTVLEP
jgi:hypothetical protein